MFARNDDINLAYERANGVVDLRNPRRLDDGHEGRRRPQLLARQRRRLCGEHHDDLDHELGRRHRRRRHAQDRAQAPPLRDPGRARTSRPTAGAVRATVYYPVLEQYCSRLPRSSRRQAVAVLRGRPTSVEVAYEAAKSKINLDDPAHSRFVVRLRNESHNCWTRAAPRTRTTCRPRSRPSPTSMPT